MEILRILAFAMLGVLLFACQSEDARVISPSPSETVTAGRVLSSLPETIDPNGNYLIYNHGKIMEEEGVGAVSPEFGLYEYENILEYFADAGFAVIGEVRSSPTDVGTYADHVAEQINLLRAAGVPAENISIVGFSKGAAITMLVSTKLADPNLNFVLIAICGEEVNDNPSLTMQGRVLSIYERSDELGSSCQPLVDRSSNVSDFQEIELDTGKRHGAFYAADPAWMDAIISWSDG